MKRIAYLIFALFPLFLHAQQANVDSLINVLETKKLTSGERLELLEKIGRFYVNNDINVAFKYAKNGLSLAEKENDKKKLSVFNNQIGIVYYRRNSFNTSFVYLNKSLEWAIKAKDKQLEMAALGNIGSMYKLKMDLQTAVDYYTKALAVSDEPSRLKAVNLYNLASIHRTLYHWDRALTYLEEAISIAHELNLDDVEMSAYHCLGTIYADKDEQDKAISCFEKALEISRKIGDTQYEIFSKNSLAASYSNDSSKYEKALEYASDALNVAEKFGSPFFVHVSLITLSNVFRNQKNYKDCKEMALKAWAIDSTSVNEGTFTALNLAISNLYMGNAKEAEYYIWKYHDIMAKGNDKYMNESLANMEIKYETEKKEIRIAALEKRRKLYIGLGMATTIALLLGIGLLFYRHRSTEQKRKIAEQQIKQLEQEQRLIAVRATLDAEKTEREIIARDLHDEVGTMLSVVKNNMDIYSMKSYSIIENTEIEYFNEALSMLDKAMTGLRRVAHHIMPAILIEKGLSVALDDFCRSIPEAEFHFSGTNRRFDSDKEIALYRCAYELVNNAMRHAEASGIDVHLNIDEKMVYLSVVDDGCGFDPQTAHPGMGINNLRTRLSAFGGRIEVYSEQGKGTEANVELEI